MVEAANDEVAKLAASLDKGSIVAAAGCGKTEQVALATGIAQGRRLILTHTHAGVDVLRARLARFRVPRDKFHIDTIAGWCLRYAASFPQRSGLAGREPRNEREWLGVYGAASALIQSGAVNSILEASYSGLFVDEYQDCSQVQHQVVCALASKLPTCIFGDPLQAIFDFRGQKPVDWEKDVFPVFGRAAELLEPWRWKAAGNQELATWLTCIRHRLEARIGIDLSDRPSCVQWVVLPTDPRFRQPKIVGTCKSVIGKAKDDRIVMIGDAVNINARAALAQKLAKVGFTNIEPVDCKSLYAAAGKIEKAGGMQRLEAAMRFVASCMVGAEESAFLKAVRSRQNGGRLGTAKFGNLVDLGVDVAQDGDSRSLCDLMEGFRTKADTHLYRREMYFAMRSALRGQSAGQALRDAVWTVQNRARHAGRQIGKRSIGSTLLVKGLEFDHSVIVHTDNMSINDWYVALTRAKKGLTILAPSQTIIPET